MRPGPAAPGHALPALRARRRRSLGGAGPAPGSIRVGLTVLSDPAMHGTVADARPPRRRPGATGPGRRSSTTRPPGSSRPGARADDLLAALRRELEAWNPEAATLFSLAGAIDRGGGRYPFGPAARARRPAAAAGRGGAVLSRRARPSCAPAGRRPARRQRAAARGAGRRRWSPTRAWSTRARLAASVLQPAEDPRPGHRPRPEAHAATASTGPCRRTRPGRSPARRSPPIPARPRAGRRRSPASSSTPTAHRQEHAIEVELPFLARLAPSSRVVGHGHRRRRLGALPAVRRAAWPRSSAASPSRRSCSSPAT